MGLSAVKTAIQQTIVGRRREEVPVDRREQQEKPSAGQDGECWWKWKVWKAFEHEEEVADAKRERKWEGRKVKYEKAFPVQEVYSGDPEESKSDTTVLLG